MASEIFAEFGLWALLVFWLLANLIKWGIPKLEKLLKVESPFDGLSSEIAVSLVVAVMADGILRQLLAPYEAYPYVNVEFVITYTIALTAALISFRIAKYYIKRPWLFNGVGGRIIFHLLKAWCFLQRDEDYTP